MPKFIYLALVLMFSSLAACSHMETVGYNQEANTVSIQANKFTSQDEVEQSAQEYCGSSVKLVSMQQVGSGKFVRITKNFSKETRRNVYTFRCLAVQ